MAITQKMLDEYLGWHPKAEEYSIPLSAGGARRVTPKVWREVVMPAAVSALAGGGGGRGAHLATWHIPSDTEEYDFLYIRFEDAEAYFERDIEYEKAGYFETEESWEKLDVRR